jgi:hypothetical protein
MERNYKMKVLLKQKIYKLTEQIEEANITVRAISKELMSNETESEQLIEIEIDEIETLLERALLNIKNLQMKCNLNYK